MKNPFLRVYFKKTQIQPTKSSHLDFSAISLPSKKKINNLPAQQGSLINQYRILKSHLQEFLKGFLEIKLQVKILKFKPRVYSQINSKPHCFKISLSILKMTKYQMRWHLKEAAKLANVYATGQNISSVSVSLCISLVRLWQCHG